jgi:hypothetical protein
MNRAKIQAFHTECLETRTGQDSPKMSVVWVSDHDVELVCERCQTLVTLVVE